MGDFEIVFAIEIDELFMWIVVHWPWAIRFHTMHTIAKNTHKCKILCANFACYQINVVRFYQLN